MISHRYRRCLTTLLAPALLAGGALCAMDPDPAGQEQPAAALSPIPSWEAALNQNEVERLQVEARWVLALESGTQLEQDRLNARRLWLRARSERLREILDNLRSGGAPE
jgi:hypothetical protein